MINDRDFFKVDKFFYLYRLMESKLKSYWELRLETTFFSLSRVKVGRLFQMRTWTKLPGFFINGGPRCLVHPFKLLSFVSFVLACNNLIVFFFFLIEELLQRSSKKGFGVC